MKKLKVIPEKRALRGLSENDRWGFGDRRKESDGRTVFRLNEEAAMIKCQKKSPLILPGHDQFRFKQAFRSSSNCAVFIWFMILSKSVKERG
jgi:hypothetical protein